MNLIETFRGMLLKYPEEREQLEVMFRKTLTEMGLPKDAIEIAVTHAFPVENPSA